MTTQPELFRAIALKHGLKLLAKGIRPNSRWTPKATFAAASRLTGKEYKRGDYVSAIKDIDAWLAERGVAA